MTDDVAEPGGHPDRDAVNGEGVALAADKAVGGPSRTEPGSPRPRWHGTHYSVWVQHADRKGAVLPWQCLYCGVLALSHEPVP
jgi:hypothetical protein